MQFFCFRAFVCFVLLDAEKTRVGKATMVAGMTRRSIICPVKPNRNMYMLNSLRSFHVTLHCAAVQVLYSMLQSLEILRSSAPGSLQKTSGTICTPALTRRLL